MTMDPRRGWMLRDSEDVNTAGGMFDGEEHRLLAG
jgi:hypothetical protein